ncbi:MAG: hypothetical protein WD852_04750 [Methyloceanibacter sp.]
MDEPVPPSAAALAEALALSGTILQNLELSELPLAAIALKASRLARLLNDFDHQRIFEYEAGGYPSTPDGVPPDVWALAKLAGRIHVDVDSKTKEKTERMPVQSIAEFEAVIQDSAAQLAAARDPDISLSSANPNQYVMGGVGNRFERDKIRTHIANATKNLAQRRAFIFKYVSSRHYELKFSAIAQDIFARLREHVDASIGAAAPDAIKTLTAIHDNLASENPEDWSNAVHGCRRLLKAMADTLYPPREDRIITIGGETRTIKLGDPAYVNRLMAFIEEKSESGSFTNIVGSHLSFIGERLDSIVGAAQKGTHDDITTRVEAERYVIYTYMLAADISSLLPSKSVGEASQVMEAVEDEIMEAPREKAVKAKGIKKKGR